MKPIDKPPIDFNWESGTATIEWIVMPDRSTGLGSGLVRFLNYEPNLYGLPYRGVMNIAIKNWVFEFKGMCFYRKGDNPLREEHEDIKDHLTDDWDMEGFALRQKDDGRIVIKRYRKRKKRVVTVGGNVARSIKLEGIKMENCDFNLKASITGVSGKLKGNYEVNLFDLPQVGIADVQNKVLVQGVAGALGALATDYAQAAAS